MRRDDESVAGDRGGGVTLAPHLLEDGVLVVLHREALVLALLGL
jgi:hypothetical protein